MISVEEAKKIIFDEIDLSQKKTIFLENIVGKILAEDIFSPIDVPSFDNSAMDGYALFFEENCQFWEIIDTVQAGNVPTFDLKKGQACRIFTGAMLPKGADTVLQQEVIQKEGNKIFYNENKLKTNANVRKKGSQCQKGQLLIPKNTLLNTGAVALLASVGMTEISVFDSPSVAIIVTGNELQSLGKALETGQIYDSNSYFLKVSLQKLGIEPAIFWIEDNATVLEQKIMECLEKYDFLVLTGGISVGDYDFVKNSLQKNHVKELFYKVKQKPAKPLFVGKKGKKWVFALPGNPASVATCFSIYLRPCLLAQMGHQNSFLPHAVLPLATDFEKKVGLSHFLKVKIVNQEVHILEGQESFNLISYPQTTHLALINENIGLQKKGSLVELFEI